jgi:Ca2+-binding RTX toxin-like protein
VSLVNGFTPTPGAWFTILTYAARSGGFNTETGLTLGGDSFFVPSYRPNDVTLVLGPGVTVVAGTDLYLIGGLTSNDKFEIEAAGSSNTGSTGAQVKARLDGVSTQTTFSQAFSAIYVYGFAGNDIVTLADTLAIGANISAGDGNDHVTAGNGNNTITLGNGNDHVTAGDGNNTVTLGDGNDHVELGNGNNTVTLGNGNDHTSVGDGNNVVVEGNGNDKITAGNGDNLIVAGLGQHTVTAGNGSNILIDGSVQLTQSGDSLRQVLDDWVQYGDLAANVASIRSRLAVTYNSDHANTLHAGSGLDWFWYTYARDKTNRKPGDLLN